MQACQVQPCKDPRHCVQFLEYPLKTKTGMYPQANHNLLAHTFLIFNFLFNSGPCQFPLFF